MDAHSSEHSTQVNARRLVQSIRALYDYARSYEISFSDQLAQMEPEIQASARNLLHYLAIRQHDLRALQTELSSLGLSSLGRSEAHVMATLTAVLLALHKLADQPTNMELPTPALSFTQGALQLANRSQHLFGTASGKRSVRIMVTMPSEAATDPSIVETLLASGMDIMRINCAHDDAQAWLKMIEHLKRASRRLGRPCKIYADLAGPKLRTGEIAPIAHLVKLRPQRNLRGETLQPARLRIVPMRQDTSPAAPVLGDGVHIAVQPEFFTLIQPGDSLRFRDARGRRRALQVASRDDKGCWAECERTAYIEEGTGFKLFRKGQPISKDTFGNLPPLVLPLRLKVGDTLLLTRGNQLGRPAQLNEAGITIAPAQIPVSLDEVFEAIRPGQKIWFDDGKIGGQVVTVHVNEILILIEQAPPNGARLAAEKGINLPDTDLPIPALDDDDLAALSALAPHIDIVGLSFVRQPEDVELLQEQLRRLKVDHLGVVLKIETRQGFENLPRLLLTSMRKAPIGIMVARGDLAVEVGFERLAEVQEQILWLCEAAHTPVIWATQVLESMAKQGIPSRAEVSDAVMSGRAECVMLNKGPYIAQAVRLLNGVLERMTEHQNKKRTMFRRLSISQMHPIDA